MGEDSAPCIALCAVSCQQRHCRLPLLSAFFGKLLLAHPLLLLLSLYNPSLSSTLPLSSHPLYLFLILRAKMSNLQASSLFDLSSKTALVTGGGTGIGLNAALALASNGATVYISGRRKEKLDDAVKHYNPTLPTEKGGKLIAYVFHTDTLFMPFLACFLFSKIC